VIVRSTVEWGGQWFIVTFLLWKEDSYIGDGMIEVVSITPMLADTVAIAPMIVLSTMLVFLMSSKKHRRYAG